MICINLISRYSALLGWLALLFSLNLSSGAASAPERELAGVKILIEREGMYRVAWRDVLAAVPALQGASVKAARVNLYNRDAVQPLLIESNADQSDLQPEAELIFHGEKPVNADGSRYQYSKYNAYLLKFNDDLPPLRFTTTPLLDSLAPRPRENTIYLRTARFEENHYLQADFFSDELSDGSWWIRVYVPPYGARPVVRFPLLSDLADEATTAALRIVLLGTTHLPGVNPDHDWTISLNWGEPVGAAQWDGQNSYLFETVIPTAGLNDKNKVRFDNDKRIVYETNYILFQCNLAENLIDSVLFDRFELEYPATLTPHEDRLRFDLDPAPENEDVFIQPGFTELFRLFDLTSAVELLLQLHYDKKSRTYFASYHYPLKAGQKNRFIAVGNQAFEKPARITAIHRAGRADQSAEYLIIAPERFFEPLKILLLYRQAQGLDGELVDVDDIFNDYAHGMLNPEAIKTYIEACAERSAAEKQELKYVFLVGSATYDYQEFYKEKINLVPTQHSTEDDFPRANDLYYGLRGADRPMPAIAVGRLPANSVEEVADYVQKIITYEKCVRDERAAGAAGKRRKALLISAEGFNSTADGFKNKFHADWEVQTVYAESVRNADKLADYNKNIQDTIVNAFNNGPALVYFVGHGAWYMWRTGPTDIHKQSDMFTHAHIAELTNAGAYPIVFTATCHSNNFDAPRATQNYPPEGIGVSLVKAKNKGAIACIGHVSKTGTSYPTMLAGGVFNIIAANEPAQLRLGDAFIAALKINFNAQAASGNALIGDPALIVRPE